MMLFTVDIIAAQQDVRRVYVGGFAGQMASGLIWLLSAAAATWRSPQAAMVVLVVGGFFIFPITQRLLRLMGRPSSLPKGHPMNALAIQVAFTLPLSFPLIFAATVHHPQWFFPAFMVAVGAHYLPFMFLYGMWQFGALTAVLVGSGVIIGMRFPEHFSLGGWVTATLLLIFAVIGRSVARSQEQQPRPSP